MVGQALRACRARLDAHIEVELIYSESFQCLPVTRDTIREVMERFGLSPVWQEWVLEDTMIPKYAMKYPSATVLVNEKDVCSEIQFAKGSSRRVYISSLGSLGEVPSKVLIARAIREALEGVFLSDTAAHKPSLIHF